MKKSILLTINQNRFPLLKQIADDKGVSVLVVIRLAIDEYLEKNLPSGSLNSTVEFEKQSVAEPTAA